MAGRSCFIFYEQEKSRLKHWLSTLQPIYRKQKRVTSHKHWENNSATENSLHYISQGKSINPRRVSYLLWCSILMWSASQCSNCFFPLFLADLYASFLNEPFYNVKKLNSKKHKVSYISGLWENSTGSYLRINITEAVSVIQLLIRKQQKFE